MSYAHLHFEIYMSTSVAMTTLTLLRHSYLNAMDWNKLTVAAREDFAADMCHSTVMQDAYRWMSGKRRLGPGKQC